DRDATGNRRFISETQPLAFGGDGQSRAVMGEQRLVRRDDMLALGDGRLDQCLGRPLGAADQLDDDIDLGVTGEIEAVLDPVETGEIDATILAAITRRDGRDLDRSWAMLLQNIAVFLQQANNTGTDGPQTGDTD